MPLNELTTIRDFLRYATSCFNEAGIFYGHGTDNAWDEALTLVLHALYLPHDTTSAVLDAKLLPTERQKILSLINERVEKRIPVAYLTKEAWFAGLPFFVDERVLIPRSPIAELILNQFSPWIAAENVQHILDMCTGSGCIAIACAQAFPDAHVTAVDISEDALCVAKINSLRHQVEDQVELIESDLLTVVPLQQYDIIVSNPPYVDAEDMASIPLEYRHEPALGLAAGHDGLIIVERLLQTAEKYLTPHGILVVEVGNSEVALMEKYPQVPFTWLEFENSDGGVFMLSAAQLREHQAAFNHSSSLAT